MAEEAVDGPLQLLVTYRKGNAARVAYSTAYTSEQWRRAAAVCYRKHGNASVIRADAVDPGDLTT